MDQKFGKNKNKELDENCKDIDWNESTSMCMYVCMQRGEACLYIYFKI